MRLLRSHGMDGPDGDVQDDGDDDALDDGGAVHKYTCRVITMIRIAIYKI